MKEDRGKSDCEWLNNKYFLVVNNYGILIKLHSVLRICGINCNKFFILSANYPSVANTTCISQPECTMSSSRGIV